jgi:hypothetical protein
MRSQVRFVMHLEDEVEFARLIAADEGTVIVDGPNESMPHPDATPTSIRTRTGKDLIGASLGRVSANRANCASIRRKCEVEDGKKTAIE